MARRIEDPKTIGRASYPTPLHPHLTQVPPTAQVRGQTPKHRDTGQETRGSMAPAASHSYRRTAGDNRRYWGGRQINEKQTKRSQEEEREMHARENCLDTWSLGGGISGGRRERGGGERGGDQSHQRNIAHNPKYGQSLVTW